VPRKRTVGSVLIDQLGFRRATVIAAFISLWAMYRATEGNDPRTVDELADALQRDRATVFRWLADFRECFPQWSDPGQLLDAAGIDVTRSVTPRGAMGLVVA
jgi:hypothetical protein